MFLFVKSLDQLQVVNSPATFKLYAAKTVVLRLAFAKMRNQLWKSILGLLMTCMMGLVVLLSFFAFEQYAHAQSADAGIVDLSNFSFSSLPAIQSEGSIDVDPEHTEQLGYDPSRTWEADSAVSDVLQLGDVQNSFGLQEFSLSEIAEITGEDLVDASLESFGVFKSQTIGSLVDAIPGLGDSTVSDVDPVMALVEEYLPYDVGLADVAAGATDATEAFNSVLDQVGGETISDLISDPGLEDFSVGNLSFEDFSVDQFSISDIPNLDTTDIKDFAGWEDASISEVPGLDEVPFDSFPSVLDALIAGFGGTHDVSYGPQEHRFTPTKNSISGGDQVGFQVQCAQEKGCANIELNGLGDLHGAQWIKGGTSEGAQMVEGGFGVLGAVNGGKEPTGRLPFGKVFKVVLIDVNETDGSGQFGLYFRICKRGLVDLGCTPYFIGPVPILSTQEKGFVLTGLLDGKGGASSGIEVPEELAQYVPNSSGGFTGSSGSSSSIQMDADCLNNLIGALPIPSSERAGASQNIPLLINTAQENGITDPAQIAYLLATAETEVGGVWQPIEEYGQPCNKYGDGCWYGRGFVQLTWEENYAKMSQEVGVDLVSNPDLALQPDIAAEIAVIGMRDGDFTGKSLDDYINGSQQDFEGARKIINDNDKSSKTAQQAELFLSALNQCDTLETKQVASAPDPGEINQSIMSTIDQMKGFSTADIPYTNGGRLACAGAVNQVLSNAGIDPLGGNPPYGSLSVDGIEADLTSGGRGVEVSAADAQPGDIVIVRDSATKRHVGFCTNVGCTETISNSSSNASFSWESDGYFSASYNGNSRSIYRITEP